MNIFKKYYLKDIHHFCESITSSKNKKIITNYQTKINAKSPYFILQNCLEYSDDVQKEISNLKKYCTNDTRIVVIYFNFLWKPLINFASYFGLRKKDITEPNWLSNTDLKNIFYLEGYEEIKRGRRLLVPIDIGIISDIINKYIAKLPIFNLFCLTTYQIFRIQPIPDKYSTSIIIPARNESGNMKGVIKKIPRLGTKTEIIFVEGNSTDNTYEQIKREISSNKEITASLFKQKGVGKGDAVRLGFNKAKNDILIILDADLTVNPKDLPKFFNAISTGKGEFINGSRLVYPMEKQAMRTLNYLGNKFFSIVFSYLLEQPVKDTLCGTKVLFRKDYQKIIKNRKYFGDFDPFGDFDLLFGASKLNLKIIEVPVKYRDRTYGTSNISRFKHGWLLLKMTLFAAKKVKFT